jgi:membrane fusion protein, multidrug efflux system
LVLAEGSVLREGDTAYVWKLAGDKLKKTTVTLGERDERRGEIVIKTGLAMGDEVLRNPSSNLKDGAPLQRVKPGAGAALAVAAAPAPAASK